MYIECESYTKFEGGLCYKCYKKDDKSNQKNIGTDEEKKKGNKDNPWVNNLIKGQIVKTCTCLS